MFKTLLSLMGVSLVLMQYFSTTWILVNYQINKDYIVQNFCVNKDKPELHCEGSCHLSKQINQAESDAESLAKVIKEISLVFHLLVIPNFQFVLPTSSHLVVQWFITPIHFRLFGYENEILHPPAF